MWDMIIVGGIITLAAGYAVYRLFFKRSSGCGCGCSCQPGKPAGHGGTGGCCSGQGPSGE